MRRALAIPSFIGFFVSLALHASAWMGVDWLLPHNRLFFAIHIAAMVNGIPYSIASLIERFKHNKKDPHRKKGQYRKKPSLEEITAPMPDFARVLLGGFQYYIFVNLLLGFAGIILGFTSQDATFFIARFFSGHWMLFFLLPAFYFWFPRDTAIPSKKAKRVSLNPDEQRNL